jgi:hypothetical protein
MESMISLKLGNIYKNYLIVLEKLTSLPSISLYLSAKINLNYFILLKVYWILNALINYWFKSIFLSSLLSKDPGTSVNVILLFVIEWGYFV